MDNRSLIIGMPVRTELIELPEQWAFVVQERMCLIDEILDGWSAPEHECLSVRVVDGRRFMLRHDANTDQWTVSAFLRTGDSACRST